MVHPHNLLHPYYEPLLWFMIVEAHEHVKLGIRNKNRLKGVRLIMHEKISETTNPRL